MCVLTTVAPGGVQLPCGSTPLNWRGGARERRPQVSRETDTNGLTIVTHPVVHCTSVDTRKASLYVHWFQGDP